MLQWNCLHHGASVNIADNKNRETPLHFAALVGNIDYIEWLIEHVADVEALDIEHRTPLHAAAYIGHDSAVQPSFLLNTVPMFIYLTTRAGCLCTLPARKDIGRNWKWCYGCGQKRETSASPGSKKQKQAFGRSFD